MYVVHVESEFSSAHRLRGYDGNCENLHGHNWKVRVDLASTDLDKLGMAVDFREVKGHLSEILDRLDHTYLNETPPFDEINPTTENISRFIYQELTPRLPEGVSLRSVTSWESPRCSVTYSGE